MMVSHSEAPVYAAWDPHFTPQWLSERVAAHLPSTLSGAVVDPACGAGNLLLAAAIQLKAWLPSFSEVRFVGIDISPKAVRACRKSLESVVPNQHFDVSERDFLECEDGGNEISGPVTVIMNPPFKGYGRLRASTRRHISDRLALKGRFNLSYAFVRHAIKVYQPRHLISILPSNWMYSRGSKFRAELDSLHGSWKWVDVGCAFEGINTDVGILHWQTESRSRRRSPARAHRTPTMDVAVKVRHGVASGRDAAFIDLASHHLEFGRVVEGVRGRDVGRGSAPTIWVPAGKARISLARFKERVPSRILRELEDRSCVTSDRRLAFEYHDRIPEWFLDEPKVLLPEIVSRELRVEVDTAGTRLPLHSVIAVSVPTPDMGRRLGDYLTLSRNTRRLLSRAPRLSGGAVRLQVGAVRDAVARWQNSRASS